jgi:hypothetical protein
MPHRARSLVLALLLLTACDGSTVPVDPDGGGGGGGRGCGAETSFPPLAFSHPTLGLVVGGERETYVELDFDCFRDIEVALEASEPGIIEAPSAVTIATRSSRATFRVRGVAEGTVTLTARATHAPSGESVMAQAEVAVTGSDLSSCSGEAEGTAAPGEVVRVTSGALTDSAIAVPSGAARDDRYRVDPFTARIECAETSLPEGYRALGPAVRFGPTHRRFGREVPLTIPLRLSLLPAGAHRGHVEVAWRGPNDARARIVPIASPVFAGSAGDGTLSFEVPRLGTYQAVVRETAGQPRQRTFTFRGILGFSMGGSGSGRIGLANPDLFDFVAPLGGPTDWTFMLEHIRRFHVGGFCTEMERVADPEGCAAGASLDRVPPTTHIHEHAQHFEHWWYEDEYDGQGGTFNRNDYISIFRDLAAMFGNPNHDATVDPTQPNIAPPGLPESIRTLPEDQRCLPENQVIIESGFFDDEFNPNGTYPVITFCDGAETGDIGQWNPEGNQRMPIEVVVAVDINGNGVRDSGEPVIRNGREPYDDFGLDGVPSELEEGYDPVTNPDPAGDDFDFQYNPTGTERNWERDGDPCTAGAPGVAEAFIDSGLDGVMDTPQLAAGGFDSGEGNGCFDRARGAQRMIDSSPRSQALRMSESELRDLDVYADGGIRDLFNWVVMGDVTMAGWSARGLPVRFYNEHSALHLDGRPIGSFDYVRAPYEEIGRYTMVRYGHPDTEERFIRVGDGGHVGTTQQLVDRLNSGLAMMSARWPDGDRGRVSDRICTETTPNCDYVNSIVTDFTASTGRTGPTSIVLPPGYFAPENQNVRYPVVYFLHGYGMTPEDLVALGVLLWQAMSDPRIGTERRMQKMILVFPDGRCRNGECLRGTFYTDAPEGTPNGAQMQQFLLDLMEHIDATYRTRSPETYEIID